LEGTTQTGQFVNNGATGAGAAPANQAGQVNRPNEPPSANGNNAANTQTPIDKDEKSLAWMFVLVILFASIAFNLWSGWNLYNIRERYRSLLSERAPAY
jgi:hypothetical protein